MGGDRRRWEEMGETMGVESGDRRRWEEIGETMGRLGEMESGGRETSR